MAIFYHPLFQEIISQWIHIFQGEPSSELQMNFTTFVEFNIKVQKCLLPNFDLNIAFVSALNDWAKEISECFTFKDLYLNKEYKQQNLENYILSQVTDLKFPSVLTPDNYQSLIEQFHTHESFKLVNFQISIEVFSKFLFDLAATWCEYLDIELFSFFIITIFLNITEGKTIKGSKLRATEAISNLPIQFFQIFENMKVQYNLKKKKQLTYYRAWCVYNYLQLNDIAERIILTINDIYDDGNDTLLVAEQEFSENVQRSLDIIPIFEKAIDVINQEINTQINSLDPRFQNKKLIQEELVNKNYDNILNFDGQQPQQPLQQPAQATPEKVPETVRASKLNPARTNQQFEISFDQQTGGVIIKKLVKLPILGQKINPLPGLVTRKRQMSLQRQGPGPFSQTPVKLPYIEERLREYLSGQSRQQVSPLGDLG